MRYWDELHPNKLGARGIDLAGRRGMDRPNRLRNGFKHAGALPGLPAVEQARIEVTSFLEDNTMKVFGIAFADIDMADVVPDKDVRDKLKAAAAENKAGRRIEGMALLVEAFEHIFAARVRPEAIRASTLSFGRSYSFGPMNERDIARIFAKIDEYGALRGRDLAEQLHITMEATSALQEGMRVIALGIEYPKYHRFQALTPDVYMTADGRRHLGHAQTYAPRSEDFDWCCQFVITVALRAAEVTADLDDIPDESKAAGTRRW